MNNSIVFVLGAGASSEFDVGDSFPVGSELALRIEGLLNSEMAAIPEDRLDTQRGPLLTAIIQANHHAEDVRGAINQIRQSILDHASIDDLLNDWRDRKTMQLVGKLAIAHIIFEAERKSDLAKLSNDSSTETQNGFARIRNSWLSRLTHATTGLRTVISRRELPRAFENVAFINFNYDRCLERYLYHAFRSRCEMQPDQSIKALERIPIIHPHGDLGRLQYHSRYDGFGPMQPNLFKAAARIHTYTEEAANEAEFKKMQTLCATADYVIFLGFGFHPKNIDLLFEPMKPIRGSILATTFGLDPARTGSLYAAFPETQRPPMTLRGVKCADMIRELKAGGTLD